MKPPAVDAIRFIEREAAAYDEDAVKKAKLERLTEEAVRGVQAAKKPGVKAPDKLACGCAGTQVRTLAQEIGGQDAPAQPGHLQNWPVQLQLVPVRAPYFDGCELLIAADCTAYACGSFHADGDPDGKRCAQRDAYAHGGAVLRRAGICRAAGCCGERKRCSHARRDVHSGGQNPAAGRLKLKKTKKNPDPAQLRVPGFLCRLAKIALEILQKYRKTLDALDAAGKWSYNRVWKPSPKKILQFIFIFMILSYF